MYLNKPVPIPDTKGITYQKKGSSTYVQYMLARTYDPVRKYNLAKRIQIGILIPEKPGMMLPNENYVRLFAQDPDGTDAEKQEIQAEYEAEKEHCDTLRSLFLNVQAEFIQFSRKRPNTVVSRTQVRMLNRILKGLKEAMKEEPYQEFLDLIPAPKTRKDAKGRKILTGATNSDVALLLSQYKASANRFFSTGR